LGSGSPSHSEKVRNGSHSWLAAVFLTPNTFGVVAAPGRQRLSHTVNRVVLHMEMPRWHRNKKHMTDRIVAFAIFEVSLTLLEL